MRWADDTFTKILDKTLDNRIYDLVGYKALKEKLEPYFENYGKFPNALITGEPGVGKTHLAHWIAFRTSTTMQEYLAPVNRKPLSGGTVFIDECHLQRRPESLFALMEDDNTIVLGATTKPEGLDPAFSSRFWMRLHLEGFTEEESIEYIEYLTPDVYIPEENLKIFASASAGNPRQAQAIVATAKGIGTWEPEKVLATCQITANGLTNLHLNYLMTMAEMTRPAGLQTLASLTAIDSQTLRTLERRLVKMGLVELTPSGRMLTELGSRYMKEILS